MRRPIGALPLLALLAWTSAWGMPPSLPGPTPATEPIFTHVDSLNGDAPLESLRDAIPWIMRNGDQRALAVLEGCLADSSLLVRDREWMIRLFTWGGPKPESPMHCGTFTLLERLLGGERLNERDWSITLYGLASLVRVRTDCVSQGTLDLLDRAMAAPNFKDWREASYLAGETMRYAQDPQLRGRAEGLLWQTLERLGSGGGQHDALDVLDARLETYFGERPLNAPELVDERLLGYAVRLVRARAASGEDAEHTASLLLSCLRARPDLHGCVDWEGLHRALLEGWPLCRLHEGNAITLANLIPYRPSWATAALIDSLFAALVPKDVAYLKRPRSSVFGAIPDCIATCAVHGRSSEGARATSSRLMAMALDSEQDQYARIELQAALATIYWHYPDFLDSSTVAALREQSWPLFRGLGPFHSVRSDDLHRTAISVRPDLLTDADFPMIWARVSWSGNLLESSLQRSLLALARTGSDATYCQILANVAAQMESTALRPAMLHELAALLNHLRTIRRHPADCK